MKPAMKTTRKPTTKSFVSPQNLLLALFITSGGLLASRVAAAPQDGAPGAAALGNEITNFQGKLKGMQRGIVIVEKDDGTQAMVAPPDSISSFQFIAKATPAFLRRGMLVRVVGNFGPSGLPVEPIKKVTLFQQVPLQSLPGHQRDPFMPGIHSANRGNQRNQPMVGRLTIVGALISLAPNGVLALQAGKTPVRIPVTAETELEVCYNNLSLAQEGDPVSVSGFYNPPNENQVKAERIRITTDRVYGEYKPEKKKTRGKKKDDPDKPAEEAEAGAENPDAEKPDADPPETEKAGAGVEE